MTAHPISRQGIVEPADDAAPLAFVSALMTDNASYVRLTGMNKADERLFDVRLSTGGAEVLAAEIAGILAKPLSDQMQREFMRPTVRQDHEDEREPWWAERKDVARLRRQADDAARPEQRVDDVKSPKARRAIEAARKSADFLAWAKEPDLAENVRALMRSHAAVTLTASELHRDNTALRSELAALANGGHHD